MLFAAPTCYQECFLKLKIRLNGICGKYKALSEEVLGDTGAVAQHVSYSLNSPKKTVKAIGVYAVM